MTPIDKFADYDLDPRALRVLGAEAGRAYQPTTIARKACSSVALRSAHLDRAQQYAESAVSSATAASRNLAISRADAKALDVV